MHTDLATVTIGKARAVAVNSFRGDHPQLGMDFTGFARDDACDPAIILHLGLQHAAALDQSLRLVIDTLATPLHQSSFCQFRWFHGTSRNRHRLDFVGP